MCNVQVVLLVDKESQAAFALLCKLTFLADVPQPFHVVSWTRGRWILGGANPYLFWVAHMVQMPSPSLQMLRRRSCWSRVEELESKYRYSHDDGEQLDHGRRPSAGMAGSCTTCKSPDRAARFRPGAGKSHGFSASAASVHTVSRHWKHFPVSFRPRSPAIVYNIFSMEVSRINSDSNKEYDIQQTAELCRIDFVDILAAVDRDKIMIERIPSLYVQAPGAKPVVTVSDLPDEFEQFRIWVENIGVFASDQESLDYRLRDALDVKEGIVSLLQSLRTD